MIFSGGSGWIAPQTARSWVGDLFLKRCVFFWDRGEVPECHSVGPWVGDLRGGGDYPTCPPWSCTERFSNPPPSPVLPSAGGKRFRRRPPGGAGPPPGWSGPERRGSAAPLGPLNPLGLLAPGGPWPRPGPAAAPQRCQCRAAARPG